MSDAKKLILNVGLGLMSLGAVALLWQHPVTLATMLLIISAGLFAVRRGIRSFAIWTVGFVFGPVAEVIAIETGAWAYAEPHLYTIPIWLPFLWANAALFLVNTEKLIHVLLPRTDPSD